MSEVWGERPTTEEEPRIVAVERAWLDYQDALRALNPPDSNDSTARRIARARAYLATARDANARDAGEQRLINESVLDAIDAILRLIDEG